MYILELCDPAKDLTSCDSYLDLASRALLWDSSSRLVIFSWSCVVGCEENLFFEERRHLERCLSSGVYQQGNWCLLSLTLGMNMSMALWMELFIVCQIVSVSWLSRHV